MSIKKDGFIFNLTLAVQINGLNILQLVTICIFLIMNPSRTKIAWQNKYTLTLDMENNFYHLCI